MLKDEMEIRTAVSVRLDEDTLFVLTYQYHTEADEADPAGKKKDRSRSRYRMLGRVERVSDLEARAKALRADSARLGPWKWPGDPSWEGRILYSKDSTAYGRSGWIRNKIKKAVSWEAYLRIMSGYKPDPKLAREARKGKAVPVQELYSSFSPGSALRKYGSEGLYRSSDGGEVDVLDRESLLAAAGQNVWREIGNAAAPEGPDGE